MYKLNISREEFKMTDEELRIQSDYNFQRWTEWNARGTEDSGLYKSADWKMPDDNGMMNILRFSGVALATIAIGVALPIAAPIYLGKMYMKARNEAKERDLNGNN